MPVHPAGTYVALYDWTDFASGNGYPDTIWQLRCVAANPTTNVIYCPLLADNVTYYREWIPKTVSSATATDCKVYDDNGYFCTSTQDPLQAANQWCTGTWSIYKDGVLQPPAFTDSATQGNTAPFPWLKKPILMNGWNTVHIVDIHLAQ